MKTKAFLYLFASLTLLHCQSDLLPEELQLNHSNAFHFNDLYLNGPLKYYSSEVEQKSVELDLNNIYESALDKSNVKIARYTVEHFTIEDGKEYPYSIMTYDISLAKYKSQKQNEYWIPFKAELRCHGYKQEMLQLLDAQYSYRFGPQGELKMDINVSIVIGGKDGHYERVQKENSTRFSSSNVEIERYQLIILSKDGQLSIVNPGDQGRPDDVKTPIDPFKPDYHISTKEFSKYFNTSRQIMVRHNTELKDITS